MVFSSLDCIFNWPTEGNETPPNNLGYMPLGLSFQALFTALQLGHWPVLAAQASISHVPHSVALSAGSYVEWSMAFKLLEGLKGHSS